MASPFIGEIRLFGFHFQPVGWAFCRGQLLSIAQNTALFALLGTTYGGNGTTTFGLPNLQGRVAVGFGNGPGLSPVDLGEMAGAETVTLTSPQLPSHSHTMTGATGAATTNRPTGAFSGAGNLYSTTDNVAMGPTGATGGSQPHENRQPYLGLNYCIALQGIFPSRN
jgi:microcystin-dependent protein